MNGPAHRVPRLPCRQSDQLEICCLRSQQHLQARPVSFVGHGSGFVPHHSRKLGHALQHPGVFQVHALPSQQPHGIAKGDGNRKRQRTGAGNDQDGGEHICRHAGPNFPPPPGTCHHAHHQDHEGEDPRAAVGKGAQLAVICFLKGLVIPELGEVALRHLLGEGHFNGSTQLSSTGKEGFTCCFLNRIRFPCHESVINAGFGAQKQAVGRNEFLVANHDGVAGPESRDNHILLSVTRFFGGGEGKIRGKIPVEGEGVVGFVLKPAPGKQEKYKPGQGVHVPRSGGSDNFKGTSGKQHHDADRNGNVDVEVLFAETEPG